MKILITGGRSNIGNMLAKKLSKRGHIVYIGVKTYEEKISLEKEIFNEKFIMFVKVIDLKDEKTLDVIDKLDLDAIILQAGIGEGGSVLELSYERLTNNIDINIIGNFLLIQKFLRHCHRFNKKGKIFVTSSIAAFLPLPYLSSYTASKIYLYQLAKTLRLELLYQGLDVDVSLILPGAYFTGFNDLMIENKSKDNYLLKEKAVKFSLIQKIFFSILESTNYSDLCNSVVKELESRRSKFIISKPYLQKVFTKLYIIISTILEC